MSGDNQSWIEVFFLVNGKKNTSKHMPIHCIIYYKKIIFLFVSFVNNSNSLNSGHSPFNFLIM